MTVRTRHADAITVHAGTRAELAAIADEYADGRRPMPRGLNAGHLERVATQLRGGDRVYDLGPLRFYADSPDGTPYLGPYAPEPDPAWQARQPSAPNTNSTTATATDSAPIGAMMEGEA